MRSSGCSGRAVRTDVPDRVPSWDRRNNGVFTQGRARNVSSLGNKGRMALAFGGIGSSKPGDGAADGQRRAPSVATGVVWSLEPGPYELGAEQGHCTPTWIKQTTLVVIGRAMPVRARPTHRSSVGWLGPGERQSAGRR